MRKLVALSMVLTAALLMGGCGLGKMVKKYPEVTVTLDNPDLENKGGEVAYTIKGTIPPKYMKKKATMTFTPSSFCHHHAERRESQGRRHHHPLQDRWHLHQERHFQV